MTLRVVASRAELLEVLAAALLAAALRCIVAVEVILNAKYTALSLTPYSLADRVDKMSKSAQNAVANCVASYAGKEGESQLTRENKGD